MAKNLLIVESPAKAKTIEKILGKDFQVESCFGHIRDLEKGNMGIDIENGFKPQYKISDDKEKVVKSLMKLAKSSEEIWLATDEDREGEAISWHLCEVLGLEPKTTKRIVFHEITKPAIQKAVSNPRTVNLDLVNAQQARRILDRIVGFEISPILWRKINAKNNLSAGRVQSVAVRILVEREREITAFKSESQFKIEAFFKALDIQQRPLIFKAETSSKKDNEKHAQDFLELCKGATYKVEDIQVKPAKKTPSSPFTTSTLQQEASRKLGYSVSKTMTLAQRLYESGDITYMRTDSVNLSETAHEGIKEEVQKSFGANYYNHRVFKNKNSGAQEAHEAIRPTAFDKREVENSDAQRLYELIWKRTLASQMSDAELEKTTARIGISTTEEKLLAKGEVLKFDGFLKLYIESTDDEENDEDKDDAMLPPLTVNQNLDLDKMKATERFSRPPSRYTEASLVKKLEELGIGRPSTYAPTISTIQNRLYVEKREKDGVERKYTILSLKQNEIEKKIDTELTGAERNKLFPTDLGMVVNDFLKQHFTQVLDYQFTAKIEQEFDEVAQGKLEWNKMLADFYTPFHKNIETTLETAERVSGERILGKDPKSGHTILVRMGRYGPMAQIGTPEEVEKPAYAKLRVGQSIETISMGEVAELFLLPRTLGELNGKEIKVNIGRFGPYALHDNVFYSLTKEMDPYTVTESEIIDYVEFKQEEKRKSILAVYEEDDIKVIVGRWGPYIKQGTENYKIPKDKHEHAADISLDELKEMIAHGIANPPKGRFAKKKVATKAPAKKAASKKTATKKSAPKKAATKKAPKK
ncbi:MAG: type I DNA topoisomerase [Chitinophagaceae bacterium]|nr:type I DNA topoisomerase [Chitinophagaceae bacterium]